MSTKTWYKEVAQTLDEMGFTYRFETGRKHTKVWVEKDGKKGMLTISVSPSDRKSLLQVKKCARRIVW